MAIILDNDTRLVVAGLTGSEGRFHGLRNRAYGTNDEQGRRILAEAQLPNVHTAATMDEAAQKVVELARQGVSA